MTVHYQRHLISSMDSKQNYRFFIKLGNKNNINRCQRFVYIKRNLKNNSLDKISITDKIITIFQDIMRFIDPVNIQLKNSEIQNHIS